MTAILTAAAIRAGMVANLRCGRGVTVTHGGHDVTVRLWWGVQPIDATAPTELAALCKAMERMPDAK